MNHKLFDLFYKLASGESPREHVLYENYDLYETPEKGGPGTSFFQNMHSYKSVREFIEKRRAKRAKKFSKYSKSTNK